jgi:opacity protein-like surface antigen
MKKLMIAALIAGQLAVPAQAAELVDARGIEGTRQGAFAGARLRVALDAAARERVRAGVTLAPTRHDVRGDGSARLRIGEGLEFGASDRLAFGLSLAGRPVAEIVQGAGGPEGRRRNVSTTGWVAIGVGVVVVAVVGYGLWLNHELSNNEGD